MSQELTDIIVEISLAPRFVFILETQTALHFC